MRPPVGVITALVLLSAMPRVDAQSTTDDCSPWQACRDLAEAAVERGDFELSHDLAWRAVQQGPPRTPELMLLLARTQSLSGRPDDALVMLRRMAEAGAPAAEALSSDDFRRVRARPGWAQVEALIAGRTADAPDPLLASRRPAAAGGRVPLSALPASPPAAAPPVPDDPPPPALVSDTAPTVPPQPATAVAPRPLEPRAPVADTTLASRALPAAGRGGRPLASLRRSPASTVLPPMVEVPEPAVDGDVPRIADAAVPPSVDLEDALRFASVGLVASALAFDSVSSRFLIGAQRDRKIVVVGEQTSRAVDLVRADSAQFFDVMAIEIDRRRGDLWVASAQPASDGADSTTRDGGRSAIHHLQLISGRPRARVLVTSADGVRLVDLAIADDGTVFALDAPGRRIWTLRAGQTSADVAALVDVARPRSLAVSGDGRRAYVAHDAGLVALDLASGTAVAVAAPPDVPLEGIERIRAHAGSLVVVQRGDDARPRVLRLTLNRAGTRVTRREIVDEALRPGSVAPAVTMTGGDFYYTTLAEAVGDTRDVTSSAPPDMVVRRARVK